MDDSEMAEHALEYALEAYPDAEITVLHVVGEPSPMMGKVKGLALDEDIETAAERLASKIFERARSVAASYDVSVDTVVAIGSPARVILNRVEKFDTVVIGSHGGSMADRLLVGNVAEKIFRRSPVPVAVVR